MAVPVILIPVIFIASKTCTATVWPGIVSLRVVINPSTSVGTAAADCPGSRVSGIGRKQTPEIREIRYRRLPRPVDSLEITTIEALRQGARESEFTGPQRINFELIVWIERGTITHEVDFARYELGPGDVLWVHTGQVQRWGDIAAVDGIVCMMPATALDTALTDRLDRIGHFSC
ncbi:putative AraC family transcriptional regulator [Gordonia polyisoprenivorans NBRC 16320 = JCM 10675]|uniref:AraC family ligand binding domain-containing protein n=1 Tax=Gordonia polyisoprenivorans TaxID=84595 RepID=UPI00023AAC4D|nr:AraC family ligand binding domain-containing protein [Gordonia polyisoprenivorans]GAB21958.1 putative AraC family transcriptional regulator [Gordonia polyisoprenivorans NBRC 16320 = JCM 10675]